MGWACQKWQKSSVQGGLPNRGHRTRKNFLTLCLADFPGYKMGGKKVTNDANEDTEEDKRSYEEYNLLKL